MVVARWSAGQSPQCRVCPQLSSTSPQYWVVPEVQSECRANTAVAGARLSQNQYGGLRSRRPSLGGPDPHRSVVRSGQYVVDAAGGGPRQNTDRPTPEQKRSPAGASVPLRLAKMGTLGGFPTPRTMVRGEQSSRLPTRSIYHASFVSLLDLALLKRTRHLRLFARKET